MTRLEAHPNGNRVHALAGVVIAWLAMMTGPVFAQENAASEPRLAIIIGERAPALERFAANELKGMLRKLFPVKVGMFPRKFQPGESILWRKHTTK